ncbi:transporter substrate-binding domain-containing protein [Aeromonas sp. MR16]|uniref:substrate-binding periplasmic protein n=1 Tax=Aeromonas sp. MR16 TaxID=2923420 RepID=UPI001F4A1EA9|nr:transporter substrate-binding domain-containing protein [Aeromonas sp. MR16]MCH7373175.1 transporter substrate-binding domain-containing protein [Aeromonas sp. MR16]
MTRREPGAIRRRLRDGCLLLMLGLSQSSLAAPADLSVAWNHWPPFSQLDEKNELTGLDVTLTRQILHKAGLTPQFRNLPWARALHLIEQQQLDLAMGALETPQRRQFARFSAPYRRASFVLLSNAPIPGHVDRWQGIRRLTDLCGQTQLRLGKLRGTRPAPLTAACPALRFATEYNSDERLIELLLARRLDGVIMEWQYANYRLTQLGASQYIHCQLLLHRQPVSLMFARDAVSESELARIDAAIADLPAPDAAFAPPVCRFDGSQTPDDDTLGQPAS